MLLTARGGRRSRFAIGCANGTVRLWILGGHGKRGSSFGRASSEGNGVAVQRRIIKAGLMKGQIRNASLHLPPRPLLVVLSPRVMGDPTMRRGHCGGIFGGTLGLARAVNDAATNCIPALSCIMFSGWVGRWCSPLQGAIQDTRLRRCALLRLSFDSGTLIWGLRGTPGGNI